MEIESVLKITIDIMKIENIYKIGQHCNHWTQDDESNIHTLNG